MNNEPNTDPQNPQKPADFVTFQTDGQNSSDKNNSNNHLNNPTPDEKASQIHNKSISENSKADLPEEAVSTSKNNINPAINIDNSKSEAVSQNTLHAENNNKTIPVSSNRSLHTVPNATNTNLQNKSDISHMTQILTPSIITVPNDGTNTHNITSNNDRPISPINNPNNETTVTKKDPINSSNKTAFSTPKQGPQAHDSSNNNILNNITNNHVPPAADPGSDTSADMSHFSASHINQIRSRHYSAKRSDGSEFQFPTPKTRSLAHSELDWSLREGDVSGFGDDFGFSGTDAGSSKSRNTVEGLIEDMEDVKKILEQPSDPKQILKAFDNYLIRSKEIDLAKLKKSRNVKLKKYKESICLGEFFNGKRHGKGIMLYSSKRLYEGDWENDVKHGKGYEILPTGSHYEGDFLNGKPDGYGVFKWKNGEIYEGEWKSGLKHGKGIWRGIKGESYEGDWKNGKAEGVGIHIWRNGDRYEGDFKSYLKHGEGVEKFANGDYYKGSYANGKPEGYGEYNWATGYQYKGNFKNGLRQGKGIWQKLPPGSGDKYEGEWVNDKKCGYGVYTWASGNRYQGHYFDDFRHGYGEMYWTEGNSYKGDWDKGIQNGHGKVIIPGKGVKKGVFKQNTLLDDVPYPVENELPISMSKPVPKGFSASSAATMAEQEVPSGLKKVPLKGFKFAVDPDELPASMSRPVKIKGYGEVTQPPNKINLRQRFASQIRNPSQKNHQDSFTSDRSATNDSSFLPGIRHQVPPSKRPQAPSTRLDTDSRDYSVDKVVNPVPKVNRAFIKPEGKQLLKYKQIIRQVPSVKN